MCLVQSLLRCGGHSALPTGSCSGLGPSAGGRCGAAHPHPSAAGALGELWAEQSVLIVCDHGEPVAKPPGQAAVNRLPAAEGSSFVSGSGGGGRGEREGPGGRRPGRGP